MRIPISVAAAILFVISIGILGAYRLGAMNIETTISYGGQFAPITDITQGNVENSINEIDGSASCLVSDTDGYNLCGISIGLGEQGKAKGVDLSKYDFISIGYRYKAPHDQSKLKVSLRNYDENYSTENDFASLKYNTVSFIRSSTFNTVSIPLKSFQVENWWINQYGISFQDAQVDFSNISYIEITTDDTPLVGKYEIFINNIKFHGKLLSETELLRLIFLSWLLLGIAVSIIDKNNSKKMSLIDPLTGILNRRGVLNWLDSKQQQQVTMLYLDIDNLRSINNTYSHILGDKLLIRCCERIQKYINEKSMSESCFTRVTGNEFAIVMVDTASHIPVDMAEGLLGLFENPVKHKNFSMHIALSIGISGSVTCDRSDEDCFSDLYQQADLALQQAKGQRGLKYSTFEATLFDVARRNRAISKSLEFNIASENFYLEFMPIVDATTFDIDSIEVLLRSKDSFLNEVGPEIFIPIAEESEQIYKIDYYVIEEVLKKMTSEYNFIKDNNIKFSVNISSKQIENPQFVTKLKTLVERYGADTEKIKFEITETCLSEITSSSVKILNDIKSMGFDLSLDDFGTGYTSFQQLLDYPLSTIKIDKSFIQRVDDEEGIHKPVVDAMISIAKAYNLGVVAEGVETHQQLNYLRKKQCDFIQGYLYSKPLNWENFKNEKKFKFI